MEDMDKIKRIQSLNYETQKRQIIISFGPDSSDEELDLGEKLVSLYDESKAIFSKINNIRSERENSRN